jgi:hypothetical protein
MRTSRLKMLLLAPAMALAMAGCVTVGDALQKVDVALSQAKAVAQRGATAICDAYPILEAEFWTLATVVEVNDATQRDVRVAVDILATSCSAVRAGDRSAAVRAVAQTYAKLMQAAAAARKQKARG